tara:strand:+ start:453 stop:824 length:372 start_codon:yes stop_codon:yes gene_type:complete
MRQKSLTPVHKLMGFEIDDNHEFLVVGQYCWGVGNTIEKAMKNALVYGDVKRVYCLIVPIPDKIGGKWEIDILGGTTIYNTSKPKIEWNHENDKIFLQTWRKNFQLSGTSNGKIRKYGFNLFE